MEYIQKNVRANVGDKISIFFFGDVHVGASNYDREAFVNSISDIQKLRKKRDSVYVVGLGDYIDAINHKDPRFNSAEIKDKYSISDLSDLPNIQMEDFLGDISPITDIIIGYIMGNHEETYVKHNGANPMNVIKWWYNGGDLEYNNLGYNGWVRLGIIRSDGKRKRPHYSFDIALSHGAGGGGMREGYPINKIHDVFRWKIADVYIMGHIHQMATDIAEYVKINHGKIIRKKSLYGVIGSYLRKQGMGTRGYFEGKPGKNTLVGMLRLDITVGQTKQETNLELFKMVY